VNTSIETKRFTLFFPIPESLEYHSSQFPKGRQGTFSRGRATLEFQAGTTNPIHTGVPLSFQKRVYTFIENIHRFISKSFMHVVLCKEAQNKVLQKQYQKTYTTLQCKASLEWLFYLFVHESMHKIVSPTYVGNNHGCSRRQSGLYSVTAFTTGYRCYNGIDQALNGTYPKPIRTTQAPLRSPVPTTILACMSLE